jgi:SNF2 family DNA or RNA helicase
MLDEALSVGDRALIFTQFVEMGHLIQRHLISTLGAETIFLHGGTPAGQRDRMVQAFQSEEGPPVFVLSLRAGGYGLNLTRANHVFHYDRWWNPAVENQATDRAFRIGQKKNVLVHKFVCKGTVEERIDEMIAKKRSLSDEILNGGAEKALTEMNNDELLALVSLDIESAIAG